MTVYIISCIFMCIMQRFTVFRTIYITPCPSVYKSKILNTFIKANTYAFHFDQNLIHLDQGSPGFGPPAVVERHVP